MGRALELVKTGPVNTTPVLMCARQQRPTLHRYIGERVVLHGIGEHLYAQMFECTECSEKRQFGLDVE
jgi:hypothetical protein